MVQISPPTNQRHLVSTLDRATKLSDTSPTATTDGRFFYPHGFMFVMPVRNLIGAPKCFRQPRQHAEKQARG